VKPNTFTRDLALALCQGDHVKADDLLQEASIAAWQRGGEIEKPHHFMSRFVSIAHREQRKRERREQQERALLAPIVEREAGEPTFLVAHDGGVPSTTGRRILHGDAYRQAEREKARKRRQARREAA
jgi:DNA-directed RNA polymerase specialized sigma24 family protein